MDGQKKVRRKIPRKRPKKHRKPHLKLQAGRMLVLGSERNDRDGGVREHPHLWTLRAFTAEVYARIAVTGVMNLPG